LGAIRSLLRLIRQFPARGNPPTFYKFHAQAIAIGGDAPSAGAVALAPADGEGNGIGTLYFAEVAVEPGERSVTMLRIVFGLAASFWWHGLPPIIAV
jgi:hypothetical protein